MSDKVREEVSVIKVTFKAACTQYHAPEETLRKAPIWLSHYIIIMVYVTSLCIRCLCQRRINGR